MIESQLRDKVPPQNIEAEQATLGSILLNDAVTAKVLTKLKPDDFYSNANRNVFNAIKELNEKQTKPDLISVTDEMRSQGTLEISGGAEYIAKLTDIVPSSANVDYYATIVQELSVRRYLLKLSSTISQKAHDDSNAIKDLLNEFQEDIFTLSQNNSSGLSYIPMKEIIPDVLKEFQDMSANKDGCTGIPSGYPDLDSITNGFQNSEFIIIGARPSIGKTALCLNMATNIAYQKNIPVCFFSLEMSAKQIGLRVMASEAKVDSERLKNGLGKTSDISALVDAAARTYDKPLYIVDAPNMKLFDLQVMARRVKAEKDVKIIFIDYLSLISYENLNLPRWEQVANISKALKSLARELNIPVIVASQVSRQAENKAPSMADIRESGSIEQDADVIMFLHRERENDRTVSERSAAIDTDLIIAKNRNGAVGTIKLKFISKYTRFEMAERQEQ